MKHGPVETGDISENMISSLYEIDSSSCLDDEMDTKMTVKVSAVSAAMYTSLANRFGITRFSLLQNLLDESAKKMFERLTVSDREAIAEIADIESFEILKKQGMVSMSSTGVRGSFDGSAFWRNYLTREELESYISAASAEKKE